jgi:hypothetical protein
MAIIGFSDQLYVSGLLAQILPGESTITIDKTFAWGTKPIGVVLITKDCSYGDYGELFIVHPTVGIVGQFAETAYLPPGEREITITNPDGEMEVPVGLKYRFILTAVDTNGRNVIIWLLVKK